MELQKMQDCRMGDQADDLAALHDDEPIPSLPRHAFHDLDDLNVLFHDQ